MSEETSGGFFGRLSPPVSPQASPSTVAATLPHSREHPLKTGGSKESTFIRFVDQNLLKIQRRYAKRGESDVERQNDTPDGIGYRSFAEAARDIEKLVDLIWVSGTRKFFLDIEHPTRNQQLIRACSLPSDPVLAHHCNACGAVSFRLPTVT